MKRHNAGGSFSPYLLLLPLSKYLGFLAKRIRSSLFAYVAAKSQKILDGALSWIQLETYQKPTVGYDKRDWSTDGLPASGRAIARQTLPQLRNGTLGPFCGRQKSVSSVSASARTSLSHA